MGEEATAAAIEVREEPRPGIRGVPKRLSPASLDAAAPGSGLFRSGAFPESTSGTTKTVWNEFRPGNVECVIPASRSSSGKRGMTLHRGISAASPRTFVLLSPLLGLKMIIPLFCLRIFGHFMELPETFDL